VNIATEILVDAYQDSFDTAFLISGDSDLVPPLRHLTALFPAKRVLVLFPPERFSNDLKQAAATSLVLGEAHLRAAQFPAVITPTSGGPPITKPAHWT